MLCFLFLDAALFFVWHQYYHYDWTAGSKEIFIFRDDSYEYSTSMILGVSAAVRDEPPQAPERWPGKRKLFFFGRHLTSPHLTTHSALDDQRHGMDVRDRYGTRNVKRPRLAGYGEELTHIRSRQRATVPTVGACQRTRKHIVAWDSTVVTASIRPWLAVCLSVLSTTKPIKSNQIVNFLFFFQTFIEVSTCFGAACLPIDFN